MAPIKKYLHNRYLDEPLKNIINNLKTISSLVKYQLHDALTNKDANLIKRYMTESSEPRLHIGCGKRNLTGWLNSDYFPSDPNIVHIDATRKYPFANNSLNYIFSEHMIEHVSYEQGASMLRECYRTLKPGGRLRIATPDYTFLHELYASEKSDLQLNYIKWATDNHINGLQHYADIFVINNYVRDWGHLFIYDFAALRSSLETAGFKNIEKQQINVSNDPILTSLENESRMPPGFLQLESLIIEALK
jgi:predicted SAM-dependent methyltransferase